MNEMPIRGDGAKQVGSVDGVQPARRGERADGGSAAFRALLENLEQRAAGLRSEAPDSPRGLADAVDAARASLEDALDLKDRLLEAYRADLRRDGAGGEDVRGRSEEG